MAAAGGSWKGGDFVPAQGARSLQKRQADEINVTVTSRSREQLLARENELYRELLGMRRSNGGALPTRATDRRRWNAIQTERNALNDEAIKRGMTPVF